MEMDKYTRKSLEVVEKAKEKALEYDNQELTQMHFQIRLLKGLELIHSQGIRDMKGARGEPTQ